MNGKRADSENESGIQFLGYFWGGFYGRRRGVNNVG